MGENLVEKMGEKNMGKNFVKRWMKRGLVKEKHNVMCVRIKTCRISFLTRCTTRMMHSLF